MKTKEQIANDINATEDISRTIVLSAREADAFVEGMIYDNRGQAESWTVNGEYNSADDFRNTNTEWNNSAPHGAGRIMSRTKAKSELVLEDYKKAMEGVYTTSVNEDTLDEAPMAYKSLDDIIDVIKESVDVIDVMKPIYNFKASE